MGDSATCEITHDFSPFFRVFKDGRIERPGSPQFAPPCDDPESPVRSKDVVVSRETAVSCRLYLPSAIEPDQKLPVLVYIHGGGFCLGSATIPTFHNFVSNLVARAKVLAVSVDYRLAPEHHLPAAYDDSWDAFRWVLSHAGGSGPDPWLNIHADFGRVFLAGESAGANIANNVAVRAGSAREVLNGAKVEGLLLIHPFFGNKQVDKMYKFMCPSSSGSDDDPRLNPAADSRLPRMVGERVLICLAEKDWLRDRGWAYHEALGKSEWPGTVEFMESEGEGHGFHLFDPNMEKETTKSLMGRLVSFLNRI